ncbi:MAG: YggT family protein [Burkholderiaceae bacterium]
MQTLWFLVKTVGGLLATACLLRAYMNWLGIVGRDPIGQFVIAVSDWIVRPLRRLVPARRGIDWASLLAAFVFAFGLGVIMMLMFGGGRTLPIGAVAIFAVVSLLEWALYLVMGMVLLQAILSWVNPHAPIAPTLQMLTHPFMAPVRRLIPLVGGSISPLVVIIAVQVLLSLVQQTVPSLIALAS